MQVNSQMIQDSMQGLQDVYVSNRELAQEMKVRHLRSGKISKEDNYSLRGTEVHALGVDELGNIVYLGLDGHIRQGV